MQNKYFCVLKENNVMDTYCIWTGFKHRQKGTSSLWDWKPTIYKTQFLDPHIFLHSLNELWHSMSNKLIPTIWGMSWCSMEVTGLCHLVMMLFVLTNYLLKMVSQWFQWPLSDSQSNSITPCWKKAKVSIRTQNYNREKLYKIAR